MRAIEFFAGIGGFATAAKRVWGEQLTHVLPIEIDQTSRRVYELNHPHTVKTREISSLSDREIEAFHADLWWLSPPCQPYSRRGNQLDIDDPRARPLMHATCLMETFEPSCIVLENVAEFAQSRACKMLRDTLLDSGYYIMDRELCPTEMGWPNRRPRFYLIASFEPLEPWQTLPAYSLTVADLIKDAEVDPQQCMVDADALSRFETGMDRVDPSDAQCVTACFGSSYGKSILHAGSYCAAGDSWRRFSPDEVARLLGFPFSFKLAHELGYRRLWKLLGNSLSIPVVEYVLQHCPATE